MSSTDESAGSEVEQIAASHLARLLGTEDEPFLLDVRQPEEVADWAIAGVHNIPLGELQRRLPEVPTDRPVVAVCRSGNRSSQAAEQLSGAGYSVRNLSGGMGAWGQVYDTATWGVVGAEVVQIRRRGKGCLSYMIGSGDEAFVVDPSTHVETYRALAEERSWRITRVFDTHLHADHLSGAHELSRRSQASLHLSPFDTFDFHYEALQHDEVFSLPGGTDVSVTALHTPGHTEGSVVFVIGGEAVLSGDTIFVDSVGRPDLAERAEEFARNLYRSLRQKVLVLPDETVIFPAHYSNNTRVVPEQPVATTLGRLGTSVPALSFDEEAFVTWATATVTPRPPNYVEIVRANMGRSPLGPGELAQLEAGPNRCSL
jgi:glyoxylase-like metal-dependent hydrolase (beta-lactamase superfamily II)/rhodanese-related sulfurtransferase